MTSVLTLWPVAGMARGHGGTSEPPAAVAPDPVVSPPGEQPETGKTYVVVEGQITDNIGTGEVNVSITVRRKAVEGGVGELIGRAETDRFGDFSVTSPTPIRGDIIVTLSKPQFSKVTREFHLGNDEYPPYLTETLTGNLVVIGRVVDVRTGEAVGDASVTLQAVDTDWNAKTDDDGRFTLKNVLPGEGYLIVDAAGYGRERMKVEKLEDFGEIVVRIKPERIVRVELVDDQSKPVAGATIELYDEPRDDFRTAVTDAAGHATFRGIHYDAAFLDLRLTHAEHVSSSGFDRQIATPTDNVESTHRFVMARAGRISGRVTDAKTGSPLNGTRVMTGGEPSHDSPRDWANDRGRFTIVGVPPGSTVVTAHLSGYAPEMKTVMVKAGQTATLDLALSAGAVVRGIVKTKKGEPVAGAFVDATRWRGHGTLGLRAITDDEGRFAIDSAPRDEFEVTVGAMGTGLVTTIVRANAEKPIEITLPNAPTRGPIGPAIKSGSVAPAVKFTDLNGQSVDLADLKGKTVLLDFWATWCGPCVADLPHLLEVYKKFGSRKDFVMISVSLDDDEDALRSFIKKRKMKWTHVFGERGGAQIAADRYGVSGIPAVFLIGPDGKVLASDLYGTDLLERVEAALKGSGTP